VVRHAHATRATVRLAAASGMCTLRVWDDGTGLGDHADGFGLPELRRRAEKLHGTLELTSPREGGTLLCWSVPLSVPDPRAQAD